MYLVHSDNSANMYHGGVQTGTPVTYSGQTHLATELANTPLGATVGMNHTGTAAQTATGSP